MKADSLVDWGRLEPSAVLVAFDVDGTLVGCDSGKVVWQLLNEYYGGDPATNKQRFFDYLDGKITYAQWVDLDVSAWVEKGAKRSEMKRVIAEHLYLIPGARETVDALREAGFRLAIISGTIDITLDTLFPDHPFEEVFTNRIQFNDDESIAGWQATPYDMEGKAEALKWLSGKMGLDLAHTVFVGDNINDLHVMGIAGRAVAFDPKTIEVANAAHHVVRDDMRGLLGLLLP